MVETEVSSRVGTRVHAILQVYTAGGSVLVSWLRWCCIRLMILVCVCAWKLHAEDDPAVESQAAVLCGNARRHLALSISLLTLRPRPLFGHPNRPVVRWLSFPTFAVQSSFFSAFPPLYVCSLLVSLPLLFRLIFCPRKRAQTSIVVSSAAPYLSYSRF